jgi:hypothetical protein
MYYDNPRIFVSKTPWQNHHCGSAISIIITLLLAAMSSGEEL